MNGLQVKILKKEKDINFGAVYENVTYYPIYMLMFLEKEERMEDFIYKPDFSVLKQGPERTNSWK